MIAYDTGIRHWRAGDLGGESLADARVVLRTNSTRMLLQAVRAGLGIAALPCILARADRTLDRVPASSPVELDGIWLVVHRDVQRTARVRVVIEAIEAHLAQLGEQLTAG